MWASGRSESTAALRAHTLQMSMGPPVTGTLLVKSAIVNFTSCAAIELSGKISSVVVAECHLLTDLLCRRIGIAEPSPPHYLLIYASGMHL